MNNELYWLRVYMYPEFPEGFSKLTLRRNILKLREWLTKFDGKPRKQVALWHVRRQLMEYLRKYPGEPVDLWRCRPGDMLLAANGELLQYSGLKDNHGSDAHWVEHLESEVTPGTLYSNGKVLSGRTLTMEDVVMILPRRMKTC